MIRPTPRPHPPRGRIRADTYGQRAIGPTCACLHRFPHPRRDHSAQRPGALRRQIPGASEAVLLRQLTELVRDGILTRTGSRGYPLHVTYAFTPYGETLGPIVEQLCAWGRQHQAATASAPSPSIEN